MGHHQNVPQTKTHCCLDWESFNAFHLVMQAAQRKQERPSRRQTIYLRSASSSNGSGPRSAPSTAEQHRNHTYDVVTLGNLCVDIFIHVDQVGCAADPPSPSLSGILDVIPGCAVTPQLPCAGHGCATSVLRASVCCSTGLKTPGYPKQELLSHSCCLVNIAVQANVSLSESFCMPQMPAVQELKTPGYLRQLQQQSTDQSLWEVGASCNFLIAAARLGMRTAAVANLGEDVYGKYLLDILQVSACFILGTRLHAPSATCHAKLLSVPPDSRPTYQALLPRMYCKAERELSCVGAGHFCDLFGGLC